MNLTNFLKQTDALTAQYSAEQLVAFIHDVGRVVPEHHREDFLEMLKSVGNEEGKASNKSEAKDIDFDEMYHHIRDNLKSIDSQEVIITGILNEEYDDWYDDSGEEFYYEDNSGISDMLEEACRFVHIMRSKVALKTAEYVIATNEKLPLLDKCYFAAYESDTSAMNYLRVLLNGCENEKKKEELPKIFMKSSVRKSGGSYGMYERSYSYSEREVNRPDSNMVLLLRFLDGQFADVLGEGLNKPEALGWTGSFMK